LKIRTDGCEKVPNEADLKYFLRDSLAPHGQMRNVSILKSKIVENHIFLIVKFHDKNWWKNIIGGGAKSETEGIIKIFKPSCNKLTGIKKRDPMETTTATPKPVAFITNFENFVEYVNDYLIPTEEWRIRHKIERDWVSEVLEKRLKDFVKGVEKDLLEMKNQ
jgi:hypothetical protein